MKAEYIVSNSHWYKICSKCQVEYKTETVQDLANFFRRDNKTMDGLMHKCKKCIRPNEKSREDARARKLKWLNTPNNKKIHQARSAAKFAYKNSKYKCSVLNCESRDKIELHHVDYEDALAVVPLCKKHHMDNHRTCKY